MSGKPTAGNPARTWSGWPDLAAFEPGHAQTIFIDKKVRNFYSVSISGYHIAEAGANPISQLAFTLANGFTYVEYYLSRGMDINAFAPNLSFFFSNGMDPEYAVMGRVAMPSRRRFGRQARLRIVDRSTAQPDARVPLWASNGRHER